MSTQNTIKVTSVKVVAVQTERADIKRLEFLRTSENISVEDRYYIVKVYLEKQIPVSAETLRLYVGREEIPKFGGFSGGLYFKVYEPQFFENHAGDSLCFSPDGRMFFDTGAVLPRKPAVLRAGPRAVLPSGRFAAAAPTLDDAAKQSLPTKQEVLRQ